MNVADERELIVVKGTLTLACTTDRKIREADTAKNVNQKCSNLGQIKKCSKDGGDHSVQNEGTTSDCVIERSFGYSRNKSTLSWKYTESMLLQKNL